MLQFPRLPAGFFVLVSLFVITQVIVFGTPTSQDAAASSDKKTETQRTRASKKKKKTVAKVPYFVFSPSATSNTTSTPVTLQSVEVSSTTTTKGAPAIERISRPGLVQPAVTATNGQLVISEFRVRGPNGMNDEFIEIANNSGADHTVDAFSGSGYGIAASDGVTRCTIPNGTVIPNRGHYLCVNSVGYSLASYPAGNGTTATGDATYTTDIPDNAGIALFNNNMVVASTHRWEQEL